MEAGRFSGSYPAIAFKLWGLDQPETAVVDTADRRVAVAVSHTAELRAVVPATAAQHAVGA